MGGFWVMVDLGVLDELMEKVRTTVTIPEYLYEYMKEIVKLAKDEDVKLSMSEIITDSIEYYISYVNLEEQYLREEDV